MNTKFLVFLGILAFCCGCGSENPPVLQSYSGGWTAKKAECNAGTRGPDEEKGVFMAQFAGEPPKADAVGKDLPPAQKIAIERKIIYTADISLVIEDLDKAQQALEKLIQENKAFIAQSEIQGTTGSPRSGRWKIRLPVENFASFRNAVARLGEVIRNSTDSKDVTDEYYDVKQRIKNKKVEEERLLEHLKKSTGNLKDILDVERELSRVREEIERFEGRMNVLENLISLTTITVHLQERRGYVPAEAPSFGTTIGRTFHGSLDLLQKAGQGVVLFMVAAGPWLVVLAIIFGPVWWLLRRRLRGASSVNSPAVGPIPPQD